MFQIAGISISIFLALILLFKTKKSVADKILFAWLIVLGFHLSFFVLRSVMNNPDYAFLPGLEVVFPLLHGPFIYLYTAAVTNRLPHKKMYQLAHFIVPIACLIMFSDFFFLSAEQQVEVFKNKGGGFKHRLLINLFITCISGIIYVIWCSLLLKKHKHAIKQQFSQNESISLNWLRYIVYGVGFLWITVFLGYDNFTFFVGVIFVILLGVFGFRQQGIFTNHFPVVIGNNINAEYTFEENQQLNQSSDLDNKRKLTAENEKSTNKSGPVLKKYEKSTLNEEASQKIYKSLKKIMFEERLFENPELNLDALSATLNVNPNHLSQVINSIENKNFYDYINQLRVESFISLISKPEKSNYKLLSLAYECGFNSKTAFNRNFKKITGLSPTEYLKKSKSAPIE
jgi:AraC-like DNA-binding protein